MKEVCKLHGVIDAPMHELVNLPRSQALHYLGNMITINTYAHLFTSTILPLLNHMKSERQRLRLSNLSNNTNWRKSKMFVPGSNVYTWNIVHKMFDHIN